VRAVGSDPHLAALPVRPEVAVLGWHAAHAAIHDRQRVRWVFDRTRHSILALLLFLLTAARQETSADAKMQAQSRAALTISQPNLSVDEMRHSDRA
jgi:hypothetical protein